jgi:SAM-dependent methyltransferase
MALRDVRLGRLLREHLDGIPLDLAVTLLPGRTRFNLGLASHLRLHARAQRRHAGAAEAAASEAGRRRMSSTARAALIDSLRRTIEKLDWRPEGTEWADYAEHTSYDEAAARRKDELVGRFVGAAGGAVTWDLGANTGRFSRIAAGLGHRVVAWDVDPAATERAWRAVRNGGDPRILPLVQDLADPSPALGWAGAERRSLFERADADVVLALALVHHLAISRNVPLPMLADVLARLGPNLVVEWVPKQDAMVRRLLATRRDVFPTYTEAGFRAAFEARFEIAEAVPIEGTDRTLFRLIRRT